MADSVDHPYVEQPELGYASLCHASLVSCVSGALSILVLVRLQAYTVFLVFPAVAVVCGLIGYRRVVRSEGTLAGKWLAVIGLNLGLVFGVLGVAVPTFTYLRARKIITGVAERFVGLVASGDLEEAYHMTDATYRAEQSFEQFGQFGVMADICKAGALREMRFSYIERHGYEQVQRRGEEGKSNEFIGGVFEATFDSGSVGFLLRAIDRDGWKVIGIEPPPGPSYLDIERRREKEQ